MSDDLIDELRAFLEENWNADLTVGQWWEKLGSAGWCAPMLPTEAYGRGLTPSDANRVRRAISEFGALGAPGGLGLLLAAPTIAKHGTPEQIEQYVRPIVTGQQAWCQLFSEPQAGSDLAGIQTKADADGEEFIVNGQKVWTSGGQIASLGMLMARTNSDVPKHQGITWFAFEMQQDGVDVRPLREMTGHALFNEVFITDARVGVDAVVGGLNNGWAVANSTLAFERAGLGAGGGGAEGGALPGAIAGQLDQSAGSFARPAKTKAKRADKVPGGTSAIEATASGVKLYVDLARSTGAIDRPTVRQALVRLHTLHELGRIGGLRFKSTRAGGGDIPGFANMSKLMMSEIVRQSRDVGLSILGPAGTLHAYAADGRAAIVEATGQPMLPLVTEAALFAQGPPIYGGTDQIQKNIIGERVLGLPKEPNQDKVTAFKDLPKNA